MDMRKRLKDKVAGFKYLMGMRFDQWFRSAYSEGLMKVLVRNSVISLTIGFWLLVFGMDVSNVLAWFMIIFGIGMFLLSVEVLNHHGKLEAEGQRLRNILEESGLIEHKDGVDVDE